ncbi:O-methyltransferase [Nordella sp. HKS 07]|uniref:O-methyltransferase n=1 Tax=Nordella sp. HKS 07 TaxID=2712222 RepID=UPI0013E12F86|nr:O-methyltransferase [Nordella sp. HKS 07]QIG50900.1 O-methyltransferase [Nordella sp. HKS 07]
MTQKIWTAVDDYLSDMLVPPDRALAAALEASADAGLPEIAVSPNQGKLLMLLARSINARSVLEIGTLGGYSTIWLARALPKGGHVVTLEAVPTHAEVARANFKRARLGAMIDVRLGKALDLLPKLATEKRKPFDFVFIDADKENIPDYFAWALKLTRPGSLIVVDNVIRGGRVIDAQTRDQNIRGVRRFNEMLKKEKRVSATTIQTVGVKGYDGFTLAVVMK